MLNQGAVEMVLRANKSGDERKEEEGTEKEEEEREQESERLQEEAFGPLDDEDEKVKERKFFIPVFCTAELPLEVCAVLCLS